ncbi:hypothetical protein BD769DRAFT_1644155 [Suillus cothurnatus]|nr:hypothetical protein BD769DRAFT_1644155 [Suillus cothurnatus]
MSGMIPSGAYMVSNVAYPDRYISMSGDRDLVGHEAGDKIQVDVTDEVAHLATLFDIKTGLYLGVDQMNGKVKGYTDPQVLQLSYGNGDNALKIHVANVNEVWALKDGNDGTLITVQPATGTNQECWTFEMVE